MKIELDFLKSMWYNRIVNRNRKFEIENEKGNLKWKINFSNGIQKRNLGFALDAEQNIIGLKIGNHLVAGVSSVERAGSILILERRIEIEKKFKSRDAS